MARRFSGTLTFRAFDCDLVFFHPKVILGVARFMGILEIRWSGRSWMVCRRDRYLRVRRSAAGAVSLRAVLDVVNPFAISAGLEMAVLAQGNYPAVADDPAE